MNENPNEGMQQAEPETYTQSCAMFRSLNAAECIEFRLAAQENYVEFAAIDNLWHPIFRDECRKINEAAALAIALLVAGESNV